MPRNNPLLSIAIPTRNRQYYCIEAIKHILSYDNQDFELCIHDHSDDRTIKEFVSRIEDKRLKYRYTTEALSSVLNMSRSLEMTRGEFVCMIGDDDTVLPAIFKWVKYMEKNNVDSICPGYRPGYFWSNGETENTGTLKIIRYKNMKHIERVEPRERLKKLFKNGIIQYQQYNLPRLYHGLIKKKVLDKIYNSVGAYFGGLSPDIYSTVALSLLVKNHFIIKDACTIAGACPASSTAQNKIGEHRGKIENAPHFINRGKYNWDESIPKYYSVETIWAETALTAAKDFNNINLYNSFNSILFNIVSIINNRNIIRLVISKTLILKHKNVFLNTLILFKYISFSNIKKLIVFSLKERLTFSNVKDINQASKLIEENEI